MATELFTAINRLEELCLKVGMSLRHLCVLCVSAVDQFRAKHTTETQRTQRLQALPQNSKSFLDRVSTGSGSDLVERWESEIVRKSRMLITDQVATAPCTDPIQVAIPTFEAKPRWRREAVQIRQSGLEEYLKTPL